MQPKIVSGVCDTEAQMQMEDHLLMASPYTSLSHLLNFNTLSMPCQLLARALCFMEPLRKDYATAPYNEAFNWDKVVETLSRFAKDMNSGQFNFPKSSYFIIVFRSRAVPGVAIKETLGELDKKAHEEASESGGLLRYWFGEQDENGRNLATCIWRNQEDAKLGGGGEGHKRAIQATRGLYIEWKVERLRLTIEQNVTNWSMKKWENRPSSAIITPKNEIEAFNQRC